MTNSEIVDTADPADAHQLFKKDDPEVRGLRRAFQLAGIFCVVMLILGLNRHFTFYTTYDQGIFNQLFWNGIHGRFFQSSLSSVLSGAVVHDKQVPEVFYHRLGQHFDPILLLWHPFYALAPNAATLVVLQVLLVTAAGLVLYVLARQYLQPPLAVMITASYYGAIAVIGPTLSNFHDLSQIPLFLFTLFLALEKRWWWLFWLMAVFTVLAREDAGVLLFAIGLYLIFSRRHPWVGVGLCSLGFGYVMLATNVFMPMFSRDISQRFMIERFGHFASGDEASTLDILWGILTNPLKLFSHIFSSLDKKIPYILGQTLPLAFVPLISPSAWVLISTPLAQLLLQGGESRFSIYIRYAITLVPGLFYGAILWWSVNQQRFRPRFRKIWIGFIILSLIITVLKTPHRSLYFAVPESVNPFVFVSLPRQWQHSTQVHSLIRQVPPDASISGTTSVIPHISSRREVLRLPFLDVKTDQQQVVEVDYVLVDFWPLRQYLPAFSLERSTFRAMVPMVEQLVNEENRYGIQAIQDEAVLLKKGAPSQPGMLEQWQQLRQSYGPLLQDNDGK